MDAESTRIVFRMSASRSDEPHQVIEVELRDEVSEAEIVGLLWPEGQRYPAYYEYEQRKKVVNWGASAATLEWLVTVEALPSAGDWFLFALALWLDKRQRNRDQRAVPDEEAGERAARHYLVMRRPPLGVNDLERVGYESNRDTGLGTYTFLASNGAQYEVKVGSGPSGITVHYMREILNRNG